MLQCSFGQWHWFLEIGLGSKAETANCSVRICWWPQEALLPTATPVS